MCTILHWVMVLLLVFTLSLLLYLLLRQRCLRSLEAEVALLAKQKNNLIASNTEAINVEILKCEIVRLHMLKCETEEMNKKLWDCTFCSSKHRSRRHSC